MKKSMKKIEITLLCAVWIGICALNWFQPAKEISLSERRPLKQFPSFNSQTIEDGTFMTDFEGYTLDQFPFRDKFRTIKALSTYKLFHQKDNNGIYIAEGQAAKLDFPLNDASIQNAANKIQYQYDNYLSGTDANIYFSIVPDKGFYLARPNGYPAMDYEQLTKYFAERFSWKYIDIFDTLSLNEYYATDSHWKQEDLLDTAQVIASAMGNNLSASYEEITLPNDFYGVYYGQAALPLKPDTITYLWNENLAACTVYNVETGKTTGIYDMDKLGSSDPYEMFLSGASAILHLENPNASTDKELIVFRDSYGSSLIPLLAEVYEKITLVDTRYISSAFVGQYVDFSAADDVLFLYSTTLLNSSSTLK